MFGDIFREVGKIVGTITGSILSIPVIIIAETLKISVDMVKEAKDVGCETYEEIRNFFNLDN